MFGDATSRALRAPLAAVIAAAVLVLPAAARAQEKSESELEAMAEVPTSAESPKPPPSYLHTALEELGFLAVQTAWYWGHDWNGDQKFSWQNWKTRFTDYHDMVLDDDRFRTGAVGHPIAGTGYYLIARGNGFGVVGSGVVTVFASSVWQFFSEWNERPATNDLLVTPAAGWVIGEAAYQLGQYFSDRGPGVVDCVGAALFSPVATMNDARACRFGSRQQTATGMTRRWHRFDLDLGTTRGTFDTGQVVDQLWLGGEAQLTTHRLYQRDGEGSSNAGPGQWTSLEAHWLVGPGAVGGTSFHASAIAWGNYWRRYDGPGSRSDGWGRLFAVGSSFDYDSRLLPVGWDRVVSAGLVGPMFELTASRQPFELRARASVYYGFSQVTSLEYPALASTLDGQFIRTVLSEHGYYYAQALLPAAELDARYGQLRLTLRGRGGEFWSINHDDNHQGQITNQFALRDARLVTSASLAIQPYCGPLRLGLDFASAFWQSGLLGESLTVREETVGASISVGL
jgi:hypothetical protein